MKLFGDTKLTVQSPLTAFSLEECQTLFNASNVISNENFSVFLAKIKDTLISTYESVTLKYNDKAAKEIMSNRHTVCEKVKYLDFTTTSENVTSIPESFNGKYVAYLDDLKSTLNVALPGADQVLDDLKMAIADLINNSGANNISTIYKYESFKRAEVALQQNVKVISKYFPVNTGKSKGKYRDFLKTYLDIPTVFSQVEKIDATINRDDLIQHIGKETEDIKGMLDALITGTVDGSIKIDNEKLKKELTVITFIAGKYVEHVSYLLTNLLMFYGAFKNNCDDLTKM